MSRYHAAQDALEYVQLELTKLDLCEGCRRKVYELLEDIKASIVGQKLRRVGEDFFILP